MAIRAPDGANNDNDDPRDNRNTFQETLADRPSYGKTTNLEPFFAAVRNVFPFIIVLPNDKQLNILTLWSHCVNC